MLLEALCRAAEADWARPIAAGRDGGGLRRGVPLRGGVHRRRGPGRRARTAGSRASRRAACPSSGRRRRARPRRAESLRRSAGERMAPVRGAGRLCVPRSERMTDWVRQVLERYGQEVAVRSEAGEASVAGVPPACGGAGRADAQSSHAAWAGRTGGCGCIWGRTALGGAGHPGMERSDLPGAQLQAVFCRRERLSHYWAALEREREAAECGS